MKGDIICVPERWDQAVDLGDDMQLLRYGSTWRFAHPCQNLGVRRIISAPLLNRPFEDEPFTITETEAGITVEPSIDCPDCPAHGWVRDSVWVPVP